MINDEWVGKAVVYGEAATKGSVRAIVTENSRFPIIKNDNDRSKAWQDRMVLAMRRCAPRIPLKEPIGLRIVVYMQRPASHYGTGKNRYRLKPSAPRFPIVKPDWDKIARLVSDSGTGVWWHDDSVIVEPHGPMKVYCPEGEEPRTEVEAWTL